MTYFKKVLPNGLTILKVPISAAESVLADVFVKVGSRSEEKSLNGISHFLEHLFFKGSRKYPTAQELSHALDAIGAEYNANTGKEHTQYYIKAAKKHFRFIFEVLTDMLRHPVFAPEEIERERGVIIEEINMYEDTPMRHVEDILEELMWPGHPLGRNIAGSKDSVKTITRQDILKYVETFYQPQNLIVAVAGAYTDAVLDTFIKKHWATLPNRPVPRFLAAKSRQARPVLSLKEKKTEQYHLALGFHGYSYNHPAYFSEMVLATILGGGMSSRLFVEIRERRGLAYYVKAAPINYRDTGNFLIQAGVRLEALPMALDVLSAELRKVKSQAVRGRELKKAKEYLKGTLTLSLESSEARLGWYLEQIAFRKRVLEPKEAFNFLDKVSPRDIKRTAGDLFRREKLNLAVIGPKGEFKIQNAKIKI